MKLEKRIVNVSYLFWWRNTKETSLHVGWNILGIVAVVFCLLQYVAFSYQARWSIFVFFAILIAWLVLAAIGSWVLAYPKNQPQPARV